MDESWTVRPALPTEAAGIERVARAAWHAAYDPIVGPEDVDAVVDRWYAPESLQKEIEEARWFFVVEAEGSVVGYAHAGTLPGRPRVAELYRIYVDPECWDVGIGTALLETLLETVCEAGVERVRLLVLAGNEVGIGFYRARGFEAVGRTTTTLEGDEYDELVFERGC